MQYSILVRAVGVLAGVLIASQPALALKLLIEQMREQIQNIE